MRLIDADSLIEHMKRAYKKRIGEWDLVCTVAVIGAEDDKAIMCKDCKYREVDNDVGFCTRTEDCDWDADDFCSRGVKR